MNSKKHSARTPKRSGKHSVKGTGAFVGHALALFGLWLVLTEGAVAPIAASLIVAPALLAAFLLGRPPGARLRLVGLLRFIPFFLWESLRGGIDVAWRALNPRMPLAPALVEYPLRLTDRRERVLLANVLSLVPGTASAELGKDRIRLHVLDVRLPIERTVRRAEANVAAVFGHALGAPRERG